MILNEYPKIPLSGLLARAEAFHVLQTSAKTRRHQGSPFPRSAEAPEATHSEEAVLEPEGGLKSAVKRLPDGLELPADIFGEICEYIPIKTGSLLLFDRENSVFAPWVSKGLDDASQNRLRFTKELVEELTGGSPDPLLLESEKLEPLRSFLSERLFEEIQTAALAPIPGNNTPAGILLITDSPSFSEPSFLQDLSEITETAGEVFSHSMLYSITRLGNKIPPLISDRQILLDHMDAFIKKTLAKEEKVALILMDIKPLIDFIGEQRPEINPFYFEKDILCLLNLMVSEMGEVSDIGGSRAILAFATVTPLREANLLNQIHISLRSFFHNREQHPRFGAIVKNLPYDGLGLSVLAEHL